MRGNLGTVAGVASAWGLKGRLRGAAGIGGAFRGCLECTVEITRRAKIQAGAAYTKERRIVLNAQLLLLGREADRDATFLHECAHVIADLRYGRNCRHDWRWQRVMALLGEPPEISHKLEYLSRETHAVVTWICTGCGEEYHYVRAPRRRIWECYCSMCGPEGGRLRAAEGFP
ncbi:MAG: SprT-like domain-containing protein [Alphaproteobacteria bacterium]